MSEDTQPVTPERGQGSESVSGSGAEAPQAQPPYGRRRALATVAIALLVLGAAAFAIFAVKAFSTRMEAAKQLDRATVLVQDADKLVVEIDEVVRAEVTTEVASQARAAEERVDGAKEMLNRALQLIDESYPDLNDDERERAELLRGTAAARLDMLEPAPAILKTTAEASSALPLADSAWKATLSADSLSDKAVAAYNKLTKAGVTESQKLNKRTAGQLSEARDNFEAAEKAFSAAPFEQYLAYIDARISLNKLSQRSDTAWLKGDIAKANSLIGDYNSADRKAVSLAKKLPSTPDAAVATAYDSATKDLLDSYFKARDAALEADRRLKEY